jgi:hypothetical protein
MRLAHEPPPGNFPPEIPPPILERLLAEGVHDFHQWRALGRKRFRIFGVTTAMARRIDELARETP